MGKGPVAPTPPDPYETASVGSAFDRVDTYNPGGGGTRHGYTDANGNFVAGIAPEGMRSATTYAESDTEKARREMLDPASADITQRLLADNTGANMAGPARIKDFGWMADDIFNAGYNRMKPGFEAENDRMLANLQARGIPVGGEAFGDAYQQQQRSVNDSMTDLSLKAKMAAGQEQSRQFGLDSAERGGSLNELMMAMGGGFNPATNKASGNVAGSGYAGLVGQEYSGLMDQYTTKANNNAANMETLGSLGGALMKCSVSAKAVLGGLNTKKASYTIQNMPLFAWKYKKGEAPAGMGQETHVGPMAESFHELTGLGSSDTISVIDMLGVLSGALQDALQRIDMLEYKANGGRVQ